MISVERIQPAAVDGVMRKLRSGGSQVEVVGLNPESVDLFARLGLAPEAGGAEAGAQEGIERGLSANPKRPGVVPAAPAAATVQAPPLRQRGCGPGPGPRG